MKPSRAFKEDGNTLFSGTCCNRTRGNDFQFKVVGFRQHTRKTNTGYTEVVDALSLETSKNRLDGIPSNMMSLLIVGGVKLDDLERAFPIQNTEWF